MSIATLLADPARRNVAVLAVAQALFQCTQTMAIATTPLAAYSLLGADKTFATVPIFLAHVGLMLTTYPAAMLMGRVGRRVGFSAGASLGILGAIVSFVAIWVQSFALLCTGGLLQGSAAAFAWHYRFAATDVASADFRAKALSLVMAGGVFAGVAGPQIAKWTVNWLDPVIFAGVYIMTGILAAMMLLLMQLIQIPVPTKAEQGSGGRPLGEIIRQPKFIAAASSSMFGYAVMTLVMSATPLAMLGCGYGFNDSATVIQGHVLAMFLPSFFTGNLIQKFGAKNIIIAGVLIEIGCALTNLAGIDFWNFFVANLLVGLGWNFCYVGGSTLLTTTYKSEERAKVQGFHDFLVYSMTATAAALSGTLQAQAGWSAINASAIPMLMIVLIAIAYLRTRERAGEAVEQKG